MITEKEKFEKTVKVFLGGTCNNSTWREDLIEMLEIKYFNPIVNDWNSKSQMEEIHQRKICDFCLYVITPKMTGVYSIAEVVDDSNKKPEKTIFCYIEYDLDEKGDEIIFVKHQLKSLDMVGKMVDKNGGYFFKSLKEVADFLNEQK